MNRARKRTRKPLMMAVAAIGLCCSSLAQASDKIYITIHNCSNSHHVVHVEVSALHETKIDTKGKVHSGDEKEFYCKSSEKCDVLLTSDVGRLNKNTSRSPWYIYVSSKHNIKASLSESEVCD